MATQTKPKPSADAATETPARVLPLEITEGREPDRRPGARFRQGDQPAVRPVPPGRGTAQGPGRLGGRA